MDGSINRPFKKISTAIQNISYNYSTIYLLGDNFYMNQSLGYDLFYNINCTEVIIQPYYCNYSGCLENGQKPKITLTNESVYFNVFSRLILKNLIINHDYSFDQNCLGCNYCPYANLRPNGTIIGDKGNALIPGQFLNQSYCDIFKYTQLFNVAGELIIEVIFYSGFAI